MTEGAEQRLSRRVVRLFLPPLTAALLVSGACSFSLDGPAVGRTARTRPVCDDSKGLVVLDGVVGAGLGVAALGTFANDEPGAGVALALLGALFIGSALHGSGVVEACRGEIAAFDGELIQARVAEVARERAPVAVTPPAPVARVAPVSAPAPRDPYVEPAPAPDDEWAAFWTVMP